jgi:hypothetical protein
MNHPPYMKYEPLQCFINYSIPSFVDQRKISSKIARLNQECKCGAAMVAAMQWVETRTTDTWWLDPKFSTAQNHIPITNTKSCKMYENLNFLQTKWLSNAKSWTRDTQWQNLNIYCYQNYPEIPQNYLGYFKKSSHWVSVVHGLKLQTCSGCRTVSLNCKTELGRIF